MDAVRLDEASGGAEEKKEAWKGAQLALGQWEADPHGVGEELLGKRVKRNCWAVDQRLFSSKEEQERSGVDIRTIPGGGEGLVPDGRRPWVSI
jgi:folylpolyglutamate synthase